MKRILASYRWRRRLVWLTVTAVVVGSAVAVGIMWPNTAPKEPAVSNVPANIDYSEPKKVRLTVHDKALALAVASRFIDTAVAGKDIDRSWDLVAPEFRAGLTRKQWDTGEMPVVPYPVREARWKLDYSDTQGVGFQMALFPTKRSHQQAQVFLIGLHRLGAGKRRHWVVDSWQAAPTSGGQTVSAGGGGGSGLSQVAPKQSPSSKTSESAVWLLVPVGLLSLIVLVPVGIASVNWYRGRRAVRALNL